MKSLIARFVMLGVLTVFGVIFYQTPISAEAAQTCGSGSYACGNLKTNGTCCRNEDKCCRVGAIIGDCYCVLKTDKCDRYSE